MSVRSIRVTEDIEAAIRYVAEREHTEKAQSLRKLPRWVSKPTSVQVHAAVNICSSFFLRDASSSRNVSDAYAVPFLADALESSNARRSTKSENDFMLYTLRFGAILVVPGWSEGPPCRW